MVVTVLIVAIFIIPFKALHEPWKMSPFTHGKVVYKPGRNYIRAVILLNYRIVRDITEFGVGKSQKGYIHLLPCF